MSVLESEAMQAIIKMARSISDVSNALKEISDGIKEQNKHLEQIEIMLKVDNPDEG